MQNPQTEVDEWPSAVNNIIYTRAFIVMCQNVFHKMWPIGYPSGFAVLFKGQLS